MDEIRRFLCEVILKTNLDMEMENLRAEVSRLQDSMNEISTYKTKFRVQQEMENNAQSNPTAPSFGYSQGGQVAELKQSLLERNNQIVKLVTDNDNLIKNNKRLIDSMLQNKVGYSVKMDVAMVLSIQSHTIELLLNEKSQFQDQIKQLNIKLEKLAEREKKDVQMQTPKIKLDMNWLQSISAKKKLGEPIYDEFDSQPFEIIESPVQNKQFSNTGTSTIANFNLQGDRDGINQFNTSNTGNLSSPERQKRLLTTFQLESMTYSPEKKNMEFGGHPVQNQNSQGFRNQNQQNGDLNIASRLQRTHLSEIKEGTERDEHFTTEKRTHQLNSDQFQDGNQRVTQFEHEDGDTTNQDTEDDVEIYDEFDVDDTDEFDPRAPQEDQNLQNSNILKSGSPQFKDGRMLDIHQANISESPIFKDNESGILSTTQRINAFDKLRAELNSKSSQNVIQNSDRVEENYDEFDGLNEDGELLSPIKHTESNVAADQDLRGGSIQIQNINQIPQHQNVNQDYFDSGRDNGHGQTPNQIFSPSGTPMAQGNSQLTPAHYRKASYEALKHRIGSKIKQSSYTQLNRENGLNSQISEGHARTQSHLQTQNSNNPFLNVDNTPELIQLGQNLQESSIDHEFNQLENEIIQGTNDGKEDSSIDSLKELLEDGGNFDSQELNNDSILTTEELKIPDSDQETEEKLDSKVPLIRELQDPGLETGNINTNLSNKSLDAFADDMENWPIEQRAAMEERLRQADRELGDYGEQMNQASRQKKSKRGSQKNARLSHGTDGSNYGEYYDIPKAIRNYEDIQKNINETRGRTLHKDNKKDQKSKRKPKHNKEIKLLKNRHPNMISNKKGHQGRIGSNNHSPDSIFQNSSYFQRNSQLSNGLQTDQNHPQLQNAQAAEMKYNFERRRNTTQPMINHEAHIFKTQGSTVNEFNKPSLSQVSLIGQDHMQASTQQTFKNSGLRFGDSDINFYSPGGVRHEPAQDRNSNMSRKNFRSTDLKKRRSNKIEDMLSHNSLLKKQKKQMRKSKRLGKKLLNKHLEKSQPVVGYSYKAGYQLPSFLDRKKSRKVPRVDCNYDQIMESKILSARSKKSKNNHWVSMVETTGQTKKFKASGSKSKESCSNMYSNGLKHKKSRARKDRGNKRHLSPKLNIYSELHEDDGSQRGSVYQQYTDRSRHFSPNSLNLRGYLDKQSGSSQKVGINRPKWSRMKPKNKGHNKLKTKGLTKGTMKQLEKHYYNEYFDTNSPHHPDFYNSLGGKLHMTRDGKLIGDLSQNHGMSLSRVSGSQRGF